MRVFAIKEHGLEELAAPNITELLKADPAQPLWIDIVGPSPDDLHLMRETLKFHPLAIEDTINQRQRPKMEEYGEHFFLILNPATLNQGEVQLRELDIFLGKHYIVTVHQMEEPGINAAVNVCRDRAMFGKRLSIGMILYVLVDTVVDSYFPILDKLENDIDAIGERVVRTPRQSYLRRLLKIKRSLAELWRVTNQQREAINFLSREDQNLLKDEALRYFLRDVFDHLLRLNDTVNVARDTVMGTIDLYFASQANRLNMVVQRLTFITIGIGVLTVISGFYGMNFLDTWPSFGSHWGVPFVLLIMLIGIGVVLYFARRVEK